MMSRKKKFTPGPWWRSVSQEILKMPEQIKISNFISGSTIQESKANANLIAAAPELLEALEDMVGLFPESPHDDGSGKRGFGQDLINKYDAAKSAIAKAYGETK